VIYSLFVGLARTIYIRCIYGIFGREITKYTVINGVYIRLWPTLPIQHLHVGCCWSKEAHMFVAGLAKTIYIYGAFTVVLAGKSPDLRSDTVYIYASGQP